MNFTQVIYDTYIERHGEKYKSKETNRMVKMTKARFANLFGASTWTELKQKSESNILSDRIDILVGVSDTLDDITLPVIFDYISARCNGTLSIYDVLFLFLKQGLLSQADLDDFNLYRFDEQNMPVSLANALKSIFADPMLSSALKLEEEELRYIGKNLWYEQDISMKVKILQKVPLYLKKLEGTHFVEFWNELSSHLEKGIEHSWKTLSDLDRNTVQKICAKAINSNLITLNDLVLKHHESKYIDSKANTNYRGEYSMHGIFSSSSLVGKELSAAKELFKDLNNEDSKIIDFFQKYCTETRVEKPKNKMMYGMGIGEQHDESIGFLLRSNSHLASPVLATYMLYNYGGSSFNIERLYACLYHMKRSPELQPLIDKLEPLAKVERDLSYDSSDLSSELIAATVLTRNATNLNSKESIKIYKETLESIFRAGHYLLILKEAARFISICGLSYEPTAFKQVFSLSMNSVEDEVLAELPQVYLDAIFLMCDRFDLDTNKIKPYVDNNIVELSSTVSKPAARKVLSQRTKTSADLFANQAEFALRVMGLNIENYHSGFGLDSALSNFGGKLLDVLYCLKFDVLSRGRHSQMTRAQCYFDNTLGSFVEAIKSRSEHYKRSFGYGRKDTHMSFIDNDSQSDFDQLPKGVKKLYDTIVKGQHPSGKNKLRSIEVILYLYAQKIKVTDIHDISERHIIIKRDDHHEIIGDIYDIKVFYNFFRSERPSKVININPDNISLQDKSGLFGDDVTDYPYGYVNYHFESVEITGLENYDFDTLEEAAEALNSLQLHKYASRSPLESVVERLAPKFHYMGIPFNENGTDYYK